MLRRCLFVRHIGRLWWQVKLGYDQAKTKGFKESNVQARWLKFLTFLSWLSWWFVSVAVCSIAACIVSCSTFLIIDDLAYFFHFSHYYGPYSSIWATVDSRYINYMVNNSLIGIYEFMNYQSQPWNVFKNYQPFRVKKKKSL